MNIQRHNRKAWDQLVEEKNRWTIPISTDALDRARTGEFDILLTPTKAVPKSWFPDMRDARTLCLASGGQQGPILAAAGANVAVFDNSPRQLAQDRLVAEREGLTLDTVEGDMADLSVFSDDTFALIFHPCSNCFVPDVRAVWRECFRVLRSGGLLLAGFTNPVRYIFDDERAENGNLEVRYPLPYSDLLHLSAADRRRLIVDQGQPLQFGHTLEDQLGGQTDAGFVITGLYEDRYDDKDPISRYMATFIATRAVKF